jgi:hypothetical protein
MRLHSLKVCESTIARYVDAGGSVTTIKEGVLGLGTVLLHSGGDLLKTIVIREVYLNEWNSGHTMRFYNKLPKKYERIETPSNKHQA